MKRGSVWLSIIVGILLGISSTRFLFIGSWLSLMLWAIIGIVIGSFTSEKEKLTSGALYGFFLTVSFLFSGYSGNFSSAQLKSFLPFSLLLGIIGAGCGIVLVYIGNYLKSKIKPLRNKSGK